MFKKPIPAVLPNLQSRLPAEPPQLVPFLPSMPYQNMILGRDSDGYIADIVDDAQKLLEAGWVEAWALGTRADGYGSYVSILINREQALGIKEVNDGYRLFERGHIKAMVKSSLPSWAKSSDGINPSHVFWGNEMPPDGY